MDWKILRFINNSNIWLSKNKIRKHFNNFSQYIENKYLILSIKYGTTTKREERLELRKCCPSWFG